MPRTPDVELRRWWRELLDSFDPQRLTVAEFCARNEISVASFYKWRKRSAEPEKLPSVIPIEVIGQAGDDNTKAALIRIGQHAEFEIQSSHAQLATDIAMALARLEFDRDNTDDHEVTP